MLGTLFELGQVSATARRLKISQPAVSTGLAKLRGFFGDDLFVRTGSGMTPTPFALALVDPIRRIMETVNQEIMQKPAFDPAMSNRRFTFSTSDIGELVFLPSIMERLRKEAPGTTVRCLPVEHAELEKAMEDGKVDIAIGYFPDLSGPAIRQQHLFHHPFACLVRADHPTIGDELTLEQFLAADHLVVSQEGRSQEIFERNLSERGLKRHILLQLPHFMGVPKFIAASDMISTVPRAVGAAFADVADLRLLDPPFDIPFIPLQQFWHRRFHNDPALQWLRALIASLFLDRDPSQIAGSTIFGGV